GANYAACCPFHNEKTPSFTVSQSKQFYHCFGCGAHGTAIGFVMEHAGLGFVDAVEELARSIGLQVPREAAAPGQVQHKVAPDLYDLMQTATRYYREQLKQSPRAIQYLKGRGLSGEIAARFGIGYAPDAWQNLASAVPDYQDASLVETGMVIEGENNKRYDRFRDRIMFPIINARGQVIGFGGRVLDKGEPKYLNSPETPLFEKGHELYGLFQAQKAIRTRQLVIVVEGYMDVVALAQHGVDYAVATLGTATTPFHVQKLLRLAEQVVFCFDGDAAGQRAAWRALENSLPQLVDGKRIGFLFLPVEHDPDSYVREFGTEAFEALLHDSLTLSGYLLRELASRVDLRTQEGRSNLLKSAQPLLTAISPNAPAMALLLRKEVAALAGITQAELEALYSVRPIAAPSRAKAPPPRASRPAPSSLRMLLRCLLVRPELARRIPEDFAAEGNEAAAVVALAEWLRGQEEEVNTACMIQHFQGSPHEAVFSSAEADVLQWGEEFDIEAEVQGVLAKLREDERKRQWQEVEAKFRRVGLKGLDPQELARYRQLFQEHLAARQPRKDE
ncbi:MAG TPA: DNA primase, partial [Gallionellaceae bacterium]|nr:DNA primase [Gallionellaceae bacterium]